METLSPPISPPRHETRPRISTSASHVSNRSRRSSNATNKIDLTETSKDKKRLNTKADPSVALREAQPAAVALEESNLEDIRYLQHKDMDGNIITDPDRSNPTRHRMERPLDTIRAFHAAADGTSYRRSSSYSSRPSPGYGNGVQENRRTSYYGNGAFSPPPRPRPGTGGYYRNSSYSQRPEQFVEEQTFAQPPYGRPPRHQPQLPQGHGESSSPGNSYYQPYDTMTSGSDDYGKSTNPSSQNSSFDRLHQMQGRKPEDTYQHDEIQPVQPPMNGYGHHPGFHAQTGNFNRQAQRNGPPLPPPPSNYARQPIQLTGSNSGPPPTRADLDKALPPKRQSWIKRRFSRRDS